MNNLYNANITSTSHILLRVQTILNHKHTVYYIIDCHVFRSVPEKWKVILFGILYKRMVLYSKQKGVFYVLCISILCDSGTKDIEKCIFLCNFWKFIPGINNIRSFILLWILNDKSRESASSLAFYSIMRFPERIQKFVSRLLYYLSVFIDAEQTSHKSIAK